jgi:tetratricopeptide (TPR) repeat protein
MSRRKLSPRINPKDPPPFWELGDEEFEELCCDLLSQEHGISHCELFGLRRQEQFGIDLKAWRDGNDGIEVAQCKAQQRFTPGEIRSASRAFLDHWDYWHRRGVRRFILIVACDLQSAKCHEAIEEQTALFADRGIRYEAWSNRILQQKLAPQEQIVRRRLYPPDFWVGKICGREIPKYMSEATGALGPVVSGISVGDFTHLTHRLSDSIRGELEAVRGFARRGKFVEAQKRLLKLTSDRSTWPFLDSAVHALALRLKTGLALELGGPTAARLALQELEALEAPEGLGVLRAAIMHREEGPEKALEFLANQNDSESRRLEAALLVEIGEYERAIEMLEISASGGSDAEVLQLRAMACLYLGEGEEAFSAAQAAFGLQPEWLSVRISFATVGYFTSLSTVAWPKHPAAWPQPVSWALVRRDDESSERRGCAAEVALKILEEADLEREPRRLIEALRLACLACDPERREGSEAFCQELVRKDRLHVPAIAWALGRGFQIDLSKNRKALEQRFNTGRADVNQIIALVACHLRDGRRQQALKVLEQARPTFEKGGQLGLWLIQEAQIPDGRSSQDQDARASKDLKIYEDGPFGLLAAVLNAQGRQNAPDLGYLAKAALAERNWAALIAACEALAQHGQWSLLALFTRELLEVIGTADAARLAAHGTFNQGSYEECLEILSQTESLFPGRKLSADLRSLKIQTLRRLGRSPEAIEFAEQLVRDEQAPAHLLDLVDLYWAKGDVPGAAFHARALGARTDLPPEEALRTAARIFSADREVARDLFKKAVHAGVPDEFLPPTFYLADRLGEWAEVQPLVARMEEIASSNESGPIRKLTPQQLQDLQRYAAEEAAKFMGAYLQGVLPVHSLVGTPRSLPGLAHGSTSDSRKGAGSGVSASSNFSLSWRKRRALAVGSFSNSQRLESAPRHHRTAGR